MNGNTLAEYIVGTWELVDPIDTGYHTRSTYREDGSGRDVISFPSVPERPSQVVDFTWNVNGNRLHTISTTSTTQVVPTGMHLSYEVAIMQTGEMSCTTVAGPDIMIGLTSRHRRTTD